MKKLFLGLGVGSLLFAASCKKNDEGLSPNHWNISGRTFQGANLTVSDESNFMTIVDDKGSSLDFTFKTLPAGGDDFNIQDEPYTGKDVAVRAVINGVDVYNALPLTGAYVIVRVNDGKYTVIMNDIKMINAQDATDTVVASAHLVQQ